MKERELSTKILAIILLSIIAAVAIFILQVMLFLGSKISTGDGKYTGTVVSAQHHGIIFKTYGVEMKTNGFTQKFEDFCVLDENIYNEVSSIKEGETVIVVYKKRLSSPSWQCASSDSSDVITAVIK